jgi:hypothetical protein
MEAVDEFIEDNKMRFHKLSKEHRDDYIYKEAILKHATDKVLREDEIEEDPQTAKADYVKRQLIVNDIMA